MPVSTKSKRLFTKRNKSVALFLLNISGITTNFLTYKLHLTLIYLHYFSIIYEKITFLNSENWQYEHQKF